MDDNEQHLANQRALNHAFADIIDNYGDHVLTDNDDLNSIIDYLTSIDYNDDSAVHIIFINPPDDDDSKPHNNCNHFPTNHRYRGICGFDDQ